MGYEKTVIVKNPSGLHARPASTFVNVAKRFKSVINVTKQGSSLVANAKSIMFILSLGIKCCDTIVISAEGEDAKEAVEALEEAALKEED